MARPALSRHWTKLLQGASFGRFKASQLRKSEGVMNELIQQLKSQVGLDDTKANSAVQIVMGFLKQRLPAPVASQLDNALSGGGMAPSGEGIKDALGGIMGKKTA
jgi:hypothetical protein